jgi:CO dehydrogenase/acetyl-CoA synthase alpha subunit
MSLTVYEYLKEELPDKTEEELQKIVYTLERIETRRRFQYLLKYQKDMEVAYKKLTELIKQRKDESDRSTS